MRKPNKSMCNMLFVMAVVLIFAVSVFGPEQLAYHMDRSTLNQIEEEPLENITEGYSYALNANEKLYILSACLDNQILPETELSEKTNMKTEFLYEELKGSYALVTNYQGATDKEISAAEVYERINEELAFLQENHIIPGEILPISESAYNADVYSAIDIREPRNNLTVWKVSLVTSQVNADKAKHVLDVYMDAETGKIYEFYVRIEKRWEEIEPEQIVRAWSEYLGLQGMKAYDSDNPLLETTPYYLKYQFPGMDGNSTIVTIGYYEGINELFLKISK